MHPRWLAMAGVLVVTSAAGCAYGIKATSDHNPQVDFSTYGTFFILKGNSSGDSLIDARLDTDVANALFAKGWVEVPQGEGRAADLRGFAEDAVSDEPGRIEKVHDSAAHGVSGPKIIFSTSHIFKEPTDRELYVLTGNGWYRSWRTEVPGSLSPAPNFRATLRA